MVTLRIDDWSVVVSGWYFAVLDPMRFTSNTDLVSGTPASTGLRGEKRREVRWNSIGPIEAVMSCTILLICRISSAV